MDRIFNNLVRSPRTHKWNEIHNILWIQSTFGKMMISHVFQHEKRGIYGIWAFWHFSSKNGHQKYSAWVPGDPMQSNFCSTLVKQYTSFIYVERMSFCLVDWAFPFVGSQGPISCRKVAKIFHAYEGHIGNSFFSNVIILYPLKISENITVFWCFQGV